MRWQAVVLPSMVSIDDIDDDKPVNIALQTTTKTFECL
jgi:hypothetical protein